MMTATTEPAALPHTPATEATRRRPGRAARLWARLRRALLPLGLLVLVAGINIASMPGEFWGGDPVFWREEARSLLLRGELGVLSEWATRAGEPGQYYVRNEQNGRYYSKFGIMNSLMSLPPIWAQRALDIGPQPGGAATIGTAGNRFSLLLFNLWNVVLSVLLAGVLYALAARYSKSRWTAVVYVLVCLYATMLSYYQRAQSSELYQALFFSSYFLALTQLIRPREGALAANLASAVEQGDTRNDGPGCASTPAARRLARALWIALAWTMVGALTLTRVLYGLLIPLTVCLAGSAALLDARQRGVRPGVALARALPWLLVPPILIVLALGAANAARFGSPWLSGYHAWQPEVSSFVGRWQDGLWGLLFAPRFSVFLYFVPLAFALPGLSAFWRDHRRDTVALAVSFILFILVLSKLPNWHGEWTFGPRYMLFVLPVASLPVIPLAERVLSRARTSWAARAWAAVAVVCVGYALYLQVQANRLEFWSYYRARMVLEPAFTDNLAAYFRDHHAAVVADDLLRHRDDLDALPYFADVKRKMRPEHVEQYRQILKQTLSRGNWYWSLPPESRG